jgi:hypothetical protein
VGSLLELLTLAAGIFSVWLGVVHVWVPRIFAYREAVGSDGIGLPSLGAIHVAGWRYQRRRSDLIAIAWVMSNAASYVLVTVGIIDLAWAAGDRTIPLGIGALWIAGWWALRAGGQFLVGRRRLDTAMAALFLALAAGHLALAASA